MTTELHDASHRETELRAAKERTEAQFNLVRMGLAGLVSTTDVIRDLELRVVPGQERRELLTDFRGGVARASGGGFDRVTPRELYDPTEDRKLLERHKLKLSSDLEYLELKIMVATNEVRVLERGENVDA